MRLLASDRGAARAGGTGAQSGSAQRRHRLLRRLPAGRQASLASDQLSEAQLLQAIRGHWDAIENGTHHRRDVSFGEDASGVSKGRAAQVLAALRTMPAGRQDLALGLPAGRHGLYELQKERERTDAPSARACCRQMTFTAALALLRG